jgi:ATP-dependent DNA helicase RecG
MEHGFPPAIFELRSGGFQVVFGSKVVNEGVNPSIGALKALIQAKPGLRSPQLSSELGIAPKTLERWIGQLKREQWLEFKGSPKTGGYYHKENS